MSFRARLGAVFVLGALLVAMLPRAASAAASLTITPATWNVVGLDSNDQTSGPDTFASGARVCNSGDATATHVHADYSWDSANPYVNLSGPADLTLPSLPAGSCRDFYFNILITRDSNAFGTARSFHITATADGLGTVSTPTPREIYVERLISQNRNQIDSITGPNGTPPETNVVVGHQYVYELHSHTSSTFDQGSSFLTLPNVIFRIDSVTQTYSNPAGTTFDTIYGDACGWDPVPTSPTYNSCVGPENVPGGKVGGSVVTTYTVTILSSGSSSIVGMIYDHSGGSYHYNGGDTSCGGSCPNVIQITAADPQADVSITKSASPDPAVAGTDETYTLNVTNDGPDIGRNVTVTDPVPNGTTFVSADNGGTESGGTVTWSLESDLAAGQTVTLHMVVHVDPGRRADLSNTASVSTTSADPNPGNDTSGPVTTSVTTSADVSITKSDSPDPVTAGNDLSYTLHVANAGPSDARNVTVTDPLPPGETFVSADNGGTESGGTVTWNLADLAASSSVDLTLVVHVDPGQSAGLSNTATVSTTSSDPDGTNNTATEGSSVGVSADLSITKSDGSGSIGAGGSGTYTITVTNNGPSTEPAGVVVTDSIPAGTTGSESEPDCAISAGMFTCTTTSAIAPGDSVSYQLVLHVPMAYAGVQVANTAQIASTPVPDPNSANDSATDTDNVIPPIDLGVAVDDGTGSVTAGTSTTYTITLTNNGSSDEPAGVVVSDSIPAGTIGSESEPDCSISGGVFTCTTSSIIPAGGSVSYQLTLAVDPSYPGATLDDTAQIVSAPVGDPNAANDQATDSDTIDTSADLSVTKTDSPDPVVVGSNLTYTLTVSNAGPSDAQGVTLTDPLPAGVSFVSADNGGSESGGTVTWNVGPVAAGSSATVHLVVTPGSVGSITNTASASASTSDPDGSNNSDSQDTQVVPVSQSADLSITKTDAPDPVVVGTDLTYTLTVSNAGPADAQNVVVTDNLPAGVSFTSADNGGTESGGVVTWNLGTVPAGASLTLHLVVTPNSAGPISNTASAGSTTPDPDLANNDATADTQVVPLAASADLSVTKSDSPDPVVVGSDLTYTLTVSNAGPADAQNVVVTDPLPAGESFVSADNGGLLSGGTVTWNLGTLAAGSVVTLHVVVTPDTPGSVTNTASVDASTADPDPSNNSDSQDTQVSPSADVSVTNVDAPDPVVVGSNLTYTIDVTNNGPSDAQNVTVTDPLPAGVSFVSADNGGSLSAGTVTWNLGTLTAGSSVTLHLVVTPGSAGPLSDTASATSSTSDPDLTNNDATADTQVVPVAASADVVIAKADAPDPVVAGSDLTYTLTVTNNGPADAQNIVVSDPLPSGTSFVSADNGGSFSAGTVTWILGTLSPGQIVLTLVVHVDPALSQNLSNTAQVASTTADPDLTNNGDTQTTTVQSSADLGVGIDDGVSSVTAGTSTSYTITVTNHGPSTEPAGAVVSDPIPAGTNGSTSEPDCQISSGTLTCTTSAPLDPGQSVSYQITLDVGSSFASASLDNGAQITSTPVADPNPVNDQAADVDSIAVSSDVSLTKTASPDPVVQGADLQYTIMVSNAGPSDAQGVVVSDPLPVGETFVSADNGGSESGGTVTWNLGALGANQSIVLHLDVTPAVPGPVSNTATVTSASGDPDGSNNAAAASAQVVAAATSADLSITKTDSPDPVVVYTDLTYTLTVANAGPAAADNVVVTDTLPASATFTSADNGGSESGGTVTWNLGTMAAGGSIVLHVHVTPTSTGPITNSAQVSSTTIDPDITNNSASADTSVSDLASSADLSITKSGSPDPVSAGHTLTYSIQVTNAGPASAHNAIVDDPLPVGTSFVSADAGGSLSGSDVVWALGDLAPAQVVTLTLVVRVDPARTNPIHNTATVASSTADPDVSNNTAMADTRVKNGSGSGGGPGKVDLSVNKKVDNASPSEGDKITYTIKVDNSNRNDASGVVIKDVLPSGLEFVSANASAGSYDHSSGKWDIGKLRAGHSTVLTVTAKVKSRTGGSTIDNTAKVVAVDQKDPTPNDDSSTASLVVAGAGGSNDPPGGTGSDPGSVAFTGADVIRTFGLLILLVFAGFAALAAGRRRRRAGARPAA